MSEEVRNFLNNYPDYDGKNASLIDPKTGQLVEPLRKKILAQVAELFNCLEKQEKKWVDTNDFSVYTGLAGYSLLYDLLHTVNPRQESVMRAINYAETSVKSMKSRKHTFLCGDSGPMAITAYLYHKIDTEDECTQLLHKLASIDVSSESDDELLTGRGGHLYSLLFIRKFIPTQEVIKTEHIRAVINGILKSGQRTANKMEKNAPPLFYYWHDKAYIGAAHGLVGICAILLEAREFLTEDELQKLVKPTIDYLEAYRLKGQLSVNYRSSAENVSDRLVHWCHGAPGFVHLFCMAYRAFGEEQYLRKARECGECVWERGLLKKGNGLCHGSAGNGYAFLQLYQLTKEPKHVYRAVKFAEWCTSDASHGCRTPDRPYSLFEGLAGTIYFLLDLTNPPKSCFPAYQLTV